MSTTPAAAPAAPAAAPAADAAAAATLDAAEFAAVQQSYDAARELVRQLKSDPAAEKASIDEAVAKLRELKIRVDALNEAAEQAMTAAAASSEFNRAGLEDLMRRRFFVTQSFELYGGVAGLYDYGPPGCALKSNLISLWRQHFILEEGMLELDLTCLTPEVVLKTSGHVDRFNDIMVRDVKTADCHRADKLVAAVLERKIHDPRLPADERKRLEIVRNSVDSFTVTDMDRWIAELNVVSPDTGNALGPSFPFNLMFGTMIGPSGVLKGYLRPETAQGIFVNFRRLLEYNGGRMPFAGATIGQAFRNEIAPRSGLLRVREFTLAEIEHFVHPRDKRHPKFAEVADVSVQLFPREEQERGAEVVEMTVGEAVARGTIANETVGYFLGRTYLFLRRAGAVHRHLRFRQHLRNEMAHYAQDCWDAELNSSYGWIECVGIADRACFDLAKHSERSKVELQAYLEYEEPQVREVVRRRFNKQLIGKTYRTSAKQIMDRIEALTDAEVDAAQQSITATGAFTVTSGGDASGGQEWRITPDMVTFERETERVSGENYYPHVVEPSFGIGRIIYCILEQSYFVRAGDEEQRAVLALSPAVAPYKVAVMQLSATNFARFEPCIRKITQSLARLGLSHKVDTSGQSIGRRYARNDELGIPFSITVDFQSLDDGTITLRERDSCTQVRGSIDDLVAAVQSLAVAQTTWTAIREQFPEQAQTASELIGRQ